MCYDCDGWIGYRLTSESAVVDIPTWLRSQEGLIGQCLSPLMRMFVVRSMMYVVAMFVQVDAVTGDVVARTERHIPSRRSEIVVDLHEWYDAHVSRIDCTMNKVCWLSLVSQLCCLCII